MQYQPNSKNPGSNPPPLENCDLTLTDTHTSTPSKSNYEHIVVHAVEVKFFNNHYTTPVIIEFGSSNTDSTVNIPVKYRKFFAVAKLIDPSD